MPRNAIVNTLATRIVATQTTIGGAPVHFNPNCMVKPGKSIDALESVGAGKPTGIESGAFLWEMMKSSMRRAQNHLDQLTSVAIRNLLFVLSVEIVSSREPQSNHCVDFNALLR